MRALFRKKPFIIALCTSLILCILGLLLSSFTDFIYQPEMGLYTTLFWFASIAVWIFYVFRYTTKDKGTTQKLSQQEKLLLFAIVAFALFLRVYHINFYAVFLDDWYWLDQAWKVSHGIITTPFGFIGDQPSNLPTFLVYPIYILTGKSYLAVRITGIIFSISSLLIVFFLARSFFNKTVAFFAIFFIATSIWDIHVSKIPWINTTINPLLIFGSLYFFYKSLTKNKLKDSLLAGIFIGMSINLLYLSAVHVLSLFFFSIFFLIYNKSKKVTLLTLLMIGFVAFLVFSPTFIKIAKYPTSSIARHKDFINKNVQHSYTNGGLTFYFNQFEKAFSRFISDYSGYKGHFFPYWGITIEPLIQVLFIIGLLYIIFKIKDKKNQLLILSFLVLFIPVVVLERGISEWREYGFFNHIYLFSAIGMWLIFSLCKRLLSFNPSFQKLVLCLFVGTYLSFFYFNLRKYEKEYVSTSLYPYENQCGEIAEYLLSKATHNSRIYLPNEMCQVLISARIGDTFTYFSYNSPKELQALRDTKDKTIIVKLNPQHSNSQVLGEYDIKPYLGTGYKEHILPISHSIILERTK